MKLLLIILLIPILGLAQPGKVRNQKRKAEIYQDTIHMPRERIDALFARSKNQTINQVNRVFWASDKVFEKRTNPRTKIQTVLVKLPKLSGALMVIDKMPNGEYKGRIVKDSTLYYELRNYIFVRDTPVMENMDIPQPIAIWDDGRFYAPPPLNQHELDSVAITQHGAYCILYDFDGQYVAGTAWNTGGPLTLAASTSNNSPDINYCVNWGREMYSPFNIVVTSDSSLYFLTTLTKRSRVIFTASCSWYSCSVGGVSYTGSMFWGSDTPGFAFDVVGINRTRAIDGAHEAGHSMGLSHQGIGGSPYNSGYGGTTAQSMGPIMGNPYSKNMLVWFNGQYQGSAGVRQYDHLILGEGTKAKEAGVMAAGYVAGDVGNNWYSAKYLRKDIDYYGLIGYHDSDYFRINLVASTAVTLNVKPWSMGGDTLNSTVDLMLELFDRDQTRIAFNSSTSNLSATISTTIGPGKYYVRVRGDTTNTNSPWGPVNYGYMGHYTLHFTY